MWFWGPGDLDARLKQDGVMKVFPVKRALADYMPPGDSEMQVSGRESGFWEVILGPFWTMFGLLRLLKVGGLRPPTPPGTWGLHPETLFFNF